MTTDGGSRGSGATPVTPSGPQAPALSLPRGGGAIRGMGETFQTNAVSGTASLTVPIAASPGRGGFGPELSLSYDSGNGNGPFGYGWALSLPRVERRTDKGLPRYRDAEDSDAFILTGADELVPAGPETPSGAYTVRRYRPRIEGLYARIERWTRTSDGDVHWRSISRDNVTTVYGTDADARIGDGGDAPGRPARVFAWLACERYDDKGNAILYEYVPENADGVDLTRPHEHNRNPAARRAQRYPKRIRYGNTVSRLDPSGADWRAGWLFEVVFDYGEDHYREVAPDHAVPAEEQPHLVRAAAEADGSWPTRPDPFSTQRAGFEVRTYRRCRRILMFHRFAELGPEPCLVRATELDYADADYDAPLTVDAELAHQGGTRIGSFVHAIRQYGFVAAPGIAPLVDGGTTYVTYVARAAPPLELEYSRVVIDDRLHELDPHDLEGLPIGVDGDVSRWVDLDGEGVAGVLSRHDGAWYYKRPLGGGHLGAQEVVASRPALGELGRTRQLVDLAGDGQLDLMVLSADAPGFHERTEEGDWTPFTPFAHRPTLDWEDPNTRLVDLDGDGLADVLVTEDDVFTCYPSLGEQGYGPAEQVRPGWDEDAGPRLVLADRGDSIYLADMSGDGLSDLVRIRNGDVSFWPSLGRARFGPRVAMDDAPWFDHPDRFDQERVRLADIDGSGTTDLVYLGANGARVYFNRSGNGWTEARGLPELPTVTGRVAVTTTDLLGTGTQCLVHSSPFGDGAPLRYLDLAGGRKPHLLTAAVNNLGAETRIDYAPSTRFSLADRRAGRPWATRLPFPVQVVERVETHDRISGNRFATRFAYHHGRYDGIEREFCGFGMVEQWDTEEYTALGGPAPADATNLDAASDLPPVQTRTWFHTGAFAGGYAVSHALAREYYREPNLTDAQADALLLADTELPQGLDGDARREACRALKGAMLRREVYALDGGADQGHPYTVTERSFEVRRLQALQANRHGVYATHPREELTYHYERAPADPRVIHKLTLATDDFGNELQAATAAYPRRTPDPSLDARERARQSELRITQTVNEMTNAIDGADDHRAPMPAESRTYELTGVSLPAGRPRLTAGDVRTAVAGATTISYEQAPTPGLLQRRLIERVRTSYRRDDLSGPLGAGVIEARALPAEGYKQAFTPALVTALFGGRVTDAMLEAGSYRRLAGDTSWWVPTGEVFYSPGPPTAPRRSSPMRAATSSSRGATATRSTRPRPARRRTSATTPTTCSSRRPATRPATASPRGSAMPIPRSRWCDRGSTTACSSRHCSWTPTATAPRWPTTRWATWSRPRWRESPKTRPPAATGSTLPESRPTRRSPGG